MQWLGVLVVIGLVVIAVKTIWPILLAAAVLLVLFRIYDAAYRKWQRRSPKPRYSLAERRRLRMHQRRGDPQNFLRDSQLRIRADAAYRKFLAGKDDGGLPPFNPTETGETHGIEDRSHTAQQQAQGRIRHRKTEGRRPHRPSRPPR